MALFISPLCTQISYFRKGTFDWSASSGPVMRLALPCKTQTHWQTILQSYIKYRKEKIPPLPKNKTSRWEDPRQPKTSKGPHDILWERSAMTAIFCVVQQIAYVLKTAETWLPGSQILFTHWRIKVATNETWNMEDTVFVGRMTISKTLSLHLKLGSLADVQNVWQRTITTDA